jgi:hypothetical protein
VRKVIVPALCVTVAAAAGGWAVTARDGASAEALAPARAEIGDWRWAPRDELPRRTDDRDDRDRAEDAGDLEPAPGGAVRPQRAVEEDEGPDPAPGLAEDAPQPAELPDPPKASSDDALTKAEVLKNGVALPPLEAPPEVRAIFEAGNTIARSPYKWGGGHGKWQDTGYDCSGSVSYALAAAGLVSASMPSGGYLKWGKPGKGKWLTIYTNPGHMYLVVAGVRFDTIARGQTGSRWINSMVSNEGYVARHWPGL